MGGHFVRRYGARLAAVNIFIVCVLAALVAFGQAGETLSLYQAMRDGKVTATFTGTGGSSGDTVKVRVAKTRAAGPGPLQLALPPGSMLRSDSAGAQSMVVMAVRGRDLGGSMLSPASRIVVSGTAAVTFVLSAYCAELEKDNPSDTTTFMLVEAPDPVLGCIERQGRALSVEAKQAAVWMHTDKATYAHVNEKFDVSRAEWAEAEAVFQACRAASPGRQR